MNFIPQRPEHNSTFLKCNRSCAHTKGLLFNVRIAINHFLPLQTNNVQLFFAAVQTFRRHVLTVAKGTIMTQQTCSFSLFRISV